MQSNQTPHELAEKAISFLELAEKFEQRGNIPSSIENYKKAAEFLRQSNFVPHRVEEINSKIVELESSIQPKMTQSQIDEIENKTFSFLEKAKEFEAQNNFKQALQQYLLTIKMLEESGWSNNIINELKKKINLLRINIARKINILNYLDVDINGNPIENKAFLVEEQAKDTIITQQPQAMENFSPNQVPAPSTEQFYPQTYEAQSRVAKKQKFESLQQFEVMKQEQEETQNSAFMYIDEAKELGLRNEFDQAIDYYEKSIQLLNSIGWGDQTPAILLEIENLKREKENFNQFQQPLDIMGQQREEELPPMQFDAPDRENYLMEFEEAKKKQKEVQAEAFGLIDFGKQLEHDRDYDGAIFYLQRAISIFQSIGWNSYIQPVSNYINEIKQKEQIELSSEQSFIRHEEEKERNERLEQQRITSENEKLKQEMGEISNLADNIKNMIQSKKLELQSTEVQKKKDVKDSAREFRKIIGSMLILKQDLLSEMKNAKAEEKTKQENFQKSKDREELDEITKMIREAAKKSKKK